VRVMMLVKASPESEAGELPSAELVAAMGEYNEELLRAGVLLAGEGMHPSSKGVRIAYEGGKRSVVRGPFAATRELVAGFWILDVPSLDAAIEWAKRVPFEDGEVEIRPIFETSDFPEEVLPPEAAAREEAMRAELQRKAAK
jgi:hypothetical protein